MKKIILFLLLFAGLTSFAQTAIKAAFAGDSYCNGCCIAAQEDSSWRPLIKSYFAHSGYTVDEIKLCNGGETILTGRWGGAVMDSILKVQPDIIFLEYSGNHWAFGIPYDTVKKVFHQLCDSLLNRQLPFVLISGMPRQNAVIDNHLYTALTKKINEDLAASYPFNFISVYDSLRKLNVPAGYADTPRREYIGADNLHWTVAGYAALAKAIWRLPLLDSFIRHHGYFLNFKAALAGNHIVLRGLAKAAAIDILAGNEQNVFDKGVKSVTNLYGEDQLVIPNTGYRYYKFTIRVKGKPPVIIIEEINVPAGER